MTDQMLSLREISDRLQIQDLLTRYALAIDTKDWALLDTCFLPDATIDYTSTGGRKGPYAEIRKWLAEALAPFVVTMHCLGNTTVDLEGDSARARTYLWNPMGYQKSDGEIHRRSSRGSAQLTLSCRSRCDSRRAPLRRCKRRTRGGRSGSCSNRCEGR